MLRKIVTRLVIANLIPLAIRAGQKALRNRKSAPARPDGQDNARDGFEDNVSGEDYSEPGRP